LVAGVDEHGHVWVRVEQGVDAFDSGGGIE